MSKVKHCQIHLTEPARTKAAAAVHPLPHPELANMTQAALRGMSESAIENLNKQMDSNVEAMQAQAEFTGPYFHDLTNVTFGENQVMVQLPDETVYLYPLHAIARVKFYYTDAAPALHIV